MNLSVINTRLRDKPDFIEQLVDGNLPFVRMLIKDECLKETINRYPWYFVSTVP